jgi:hypothetical protein
MVPTFAGFMIGPRVARLTREFRSSVNGCIEGFGHAELRKVNRNPLLSLPSSDADSGIYLVVVRTLRSQLLKAGVGYQYFRLA